jgi:hypothetical protein
MPATKSAGIKTISAAKGNNNARITDNNPKVQAIEKIGAAIIFAKGEIKGNCENNAIEYGVVSIFEANVRLIGETTKSLIFLDLHAIHDVINPAKRIIPKVDPADKNKDTDTADTGSKIKKAQMHTAKAFNDALLLPNIQALDEIKIIAEARTAEIGTPANTKYMHTNNTERAKVIFLDTLNPLSKLQKTAVTMAKCAPETATRCANPQVLNAS